MTNHDHYSIGVATFTGTVALAVLAVINQLLAMTPAEQLTLLGQVGVAVGAVVTVYKLVLKPAIGHLKTFHRQASTLFDVPPAVERIEKRLVLNEGRHRAVMNEAAEAIFECGPQGECRWVNAKLQEMMGAVGDEMLGAGWVTFLCTDDRERVYSEWQDAVAQKRDFVSSYCFTPRRGKDIKVKCKAHALLDEKDMSLIGYLGVIVEQEG